MIDIPSEKRKIVNMNYTRLISLPPLFFKINNLDKEQDIYLEVKINAEGFIIIKPVYKKVNEVV